MFLTFCFEFTWELQKNHRDRTKSPTCLSRVLAPYLARVHFPKQRNSHWYRFYSHFSTVSTDILSLFQDSIPDATLHSLAWSPLSFPARDSFSVSPCFSWLWLFWRILVRCFVGYSLIGVWCFLLIRVIHFGEEYHCDEVPFLPWYQYDVTTTYAGDVSLNMVNVGPSRSVPCKVIVLPFLYSFERDIKSSLHSGRRKGEYQRICSHMLKSP